MNLSFDKSLTAYTPCFGLRPDRMARMCAASSASNQFQKVELVKFARPEESFNELES